MAKSAQLQIADFRAINRLVGECRELGDDPIRWRLHLAAELGRLTGAVFGVCGELAGCTSGRRQDLGTTDWGWENGLNRKGWLKALGEFQRDPLYNPLMNAYIDRYASAGGDSLTRVDMIPDGDWYPSAYFQDVQLTVGVDASLFCFNPVPGATDEVAEIILAKATGEKDFTLRDRVLVREAHAALAPLVGGPLARYGEPSPSDLPPRTRQVLRCLLEGDSDKQVAARLRMSGHTVNDHTKVIYRHFGVAGRAELLARWIRHGWGSRCAWDDGETR